MAEVLFQDFKGIWCPITELYYSLPTTTLVSRHPKSSVSEVVSSYCPQCLLNKDSYSGYCDSCMQCPCCQSVLSIGENNWHCGLCLWKCPEKNLCDLIQKSVTDKVFASLLSAYSERNPVDHKGIKRFDKNLKAGWQMDNLNAKLANSYDVNKTDEINLVENIITMGAANINSTLMTEAAFISARSDLELCSSSQNFSSISCTDETQFSKLLPSYVKLRTKRIIRSHTTGRKNILVQPKSTPLEGDSSCNAHKGKWWIKDSSAILEVPFISIVSLPNWQELHEGKYSFLCISITNPKDQDIVFSFSALTVNSPSPYYSLDNRCRTSIVSNYHSLQASPLKNNAQQHSPTSYINTNENNDCSNDSNTSSSSSEEDVDTMLDILIGGYEDELLRDDDASSVQKMKKVEEKQQLSIDWSYTVQYNRAIVHIPVCIATTIAEIKSNRYELQLLAKVTSSSSILSKGLTENLSFASNTFQLPIKIILSENN